MPAFYAHHCPVCGRIGDKRCIAVEHYVECPTHDGSFHSKRAGCIKCAAALRRQERSSGSAAAQRDKENERPGDVEAHAKKKRPKKGRGKPAHEKTIKEVRREKRAARKAQPSTATATATATREGGEEVVEEEVVEGGKGSARGGKKAT